MSYEEYIKSPRWRNNPARLAELRAAHFRCRLCHRPDSETTLEVHHRTYCRLGREKVGDLLTLCTECHDEVTGFLRRRRYRQFKPQARDVITSIESPSALYDPTW